MEYSTIIYSYSHKEFLMIGKTVHDTLQCDLSSSYKQNDDGHFFLKEQYCISELVFHRRSQRGAKGTLPHPHPGRPSSSRPSTELYPSVNSFPPPMFPVRTADGPSHGMLCSQPRRPQNLAARRRRSDAPDFVVGRPTWFLS